MDRLKSLFFLLICLLNFNFKCIRGESPKIVIVGAGVSGIAAATKLIEAGFDDVTILEAENRIGGRVYTKPFSEYVVDMGAQWVHGEKGNVVYELVWPMGILEHMEEYRMIFNMLHSNGERAFDYDTSKNLILFYDELYNPNDTVLESYGDFFKREFDKYLEQHPELVPMKYQLLRFYQSIVTTVDSAPNWDVMTSANEWGVEGDKGINWKERGYGTIIDILMKKYPDPTKELPVVEKIKLNTEVTKIDYKDPNETVKVHTKNGDVLEADHVVVTVSLGVLKATHDTLFDPPIPEAKQNFIKYQGFGCVAKIYLLFDHVWWIPEDVETNGFNILWNEEDVAALENNPDKRWQLDIIGFFRVEHKPKILCIWLSMDGAKQVELMTDEQLLPQINELLQITSKQFNVSEPTEMLRSKWCSDDHFRGTYSYESMDAIENNVNVTDLIEPIDNFKIMFAGEATEPVVFGTVNGAIGTGWREANRLINHYNLLNDKKEV